MRCWILLVRGSIGDDGEPFAEGFAEFGVRAFFEHVDREIRYAFRPYSARNSASASSQSDSGLPCRPSAWRRCAMK